MTCAVEPGSPPSIMEAILTHTFLARSRSAKFEDVPANQRLRHWGWRLCGNVEMATDAAAKSAHWTTAHCDHFLKIEPSTTKHSHYLPVTTAHSRRTRLRNAIVHRHAHQFPRDSLWPWGSSHIRLISAIHTSSPNPAYYRPFARPFQKLALRSRYLITSQTRFREIDWSGPVGVEKRSSRR